MNSSDKIALALEAALETASAESKEALRSALNDFAETYHRSYVGVLKQPFAAKMVDAILVATS
jgi:hypothetical protein